MTSSGAGSGDGGPPGKDALCIILALLAAVLGAPHLSELVGPVLEKLVFEAYKSHEFAEWAGSVSGLLCGAVIFAVTRMVLWLAIATILAVAAMRFGSLIMLGAG